MAEFADYIGLPHVVGVNSGTDALTLALDAFGVGPGDEVLVPAMTAPATALAVKRLGAQPRIVDVELMTRGMDPRIAPPSIRPPRDYRRSSSRLSGADARDRRHRSCQRADGDRGLRPSPWRSGSRDPRGQLWRCGGIQLLSDEESGCSLEMAAVATRSDSSRAGAPCRFYGFDERRVCLEVGLNSRLDEM